MNVEPDLAMELITALDSLRRYQWHPNHKPPIRQSEMMLLFCLSFNMDQERMGLRPSELGELLDIARPTVTTMVNSLERQGYLKRDNDETDRRVVLIRLTEKGEELVEQGRLVFKDTVTELVEFLGLDDTKELIRLVTRVKEFRDKKKQSPDRS